MTHADTVRHETVADDRIAVIQLAAPDRNNVLDMEMIQALGATITAADRDDAIQGIVLTADGERFCAGADLEYLTSISFEEGLRFMTAYFETLDLLRQTGKPVVAGVHGICAAGGTELISACDLIVADETARFTQPEVGVGATAAGGGVQLLPLIVGEKRAKDLLLTGRTLDASEAKAFGLINRVVPDGEAAERAIELVEMIVENHSPQAYRSIKAILKPWTNFGLLGQEMARELTAAVWDSPEFRDRSNAFLADEPFDERSFSGVRPPENPSEKD